MYGEWCLDDYIVNDLVCRGCIDIQHDDQSLFRGSKL